MQLFEKLDVSSYLAKKTIIFDGDTGSGEVGAVDVFNITGLVKARFIARCTDDLVSDNDPGGATISMGVSGSETAFIALTTAENIDEDEIWHDASPDATIELESVAPWYFINGEDVILDVGTDDIVDGAIEIICEYIPFSDNASVAIA